MNDIEKNYNSNKIPENKKQKKYMELNEEDEEEDNVSENEKKDKFEDINNININKDDTKLISKNGNKINLSGKDLSKENSKDFLDNLYQKYPNATEIEINNCNLEKYPTVLLNFKKLISLDLRNNNFSDFESLSEELSNYNNLTDLKIDLTDQNQVLMILSQIPKLIFLNGKSTKEAVTIVDLDEKDIQDISLQNEVESFNEIINKLNEKEENLNNNQQNNNQNDSSVFLFSNEFQNKLYEEAEKIKLSLNNNLPNYIYANYVLQSQFELKKMLSNKFLSFLKEEDKNIGNLIFDSVYKTGERFVNLVNTLFPKIEEKTDSLRNQLEEAWKIADEITDFEGKYKETKKEKEILSSNFELIKLKLKKLEEENNMLTQKFLQISKDIEKKNSENILIKNETESNNFLKSENQNKKSETNLNISNKDLDKESSKILFSKNNNNSNYSLTNNSVNNNNLSIYNNRENENKNETSSNKKTKVLSLKMTKDIMNEIYNSKVAFDKKCYESGKPRETLEQHMYTYLNQKYGLKNLIIEWASSIINAIKLYSSEDCEINLFGKILRNEQEEDSRLILNKLQENISELLEYYLKSKNPLKSQNEIKKLLLQKKNGILTEEEWKGIIYYEYNEENAKILENKITSFIQKQREKERNNELLPINTVSELNHTFNTGNNNYLLSGNTSIEYGKNNSPLYLGTQASKKRTRREMFNLFKFQEDDSILYKNFIKIVGDYQIRNREKYLRNFVKLFRKFDTDFDGVLNESEFINMIKDIPFCQNNLDDYIFRFLSTIDPFNNKKITFNECISLFSMEIIEENKNSITDSNNKEKIQQENNGNNNNENNNENSNNINNENSNNSDNNNRKIQITLLDKICLDDNNC